jgi:hypothetical protein
MKKIAVACLLYLSVAIPNAQAQIFRIGPEFGFNAAFQNNIYPKDSLVINNDIQDSKFSPGFNIGLMADVKLMRNLYIQAGAFYQFDNIKYNSEKTYPNLAPNVTVPTVNTKHYFNTIKVPLYVMYKSGLEGSGRFMIGAGPYFSYYMSGRNASKVAIPVLDNNNQITNFQIGSINSNLKFDDESHSQFNRVDYGANVCMGYESNIGMYFRLNYNQGFTNINYKKSDIETNNWGLQFTVGFLLGKDTW